MKSVTETVIRDQFPFLRDALTLPASQLKAPVLVFVGCGTSYYLARTLAAAANIGGRPAIAVPGAEWTRFANAYLASNDGAVVIGLSRSGTTTETVAAISASRERGLKTVAISCEAGSTILQAAEEAVYLPTDPREGIVMSVSASLMLLAGLRMVGVSITEDDITLAQSWLVALDAAIPIIEGRSHFVFLGAGALYGIACEGALKLMEMSLHPAQAFHPMEYRHGPISLIDERSLVVMLYSAQTQGDEAPLVAELQAKGAQVIGFGGPGDLSIGQAADGPAAALRVLPALQLLGEKVAISQNINTETPRHLTKVVVLN
ncbi:SIS domain-containing protein [Pelagibacterium sp. H642]|uniref:SIS domain-containing protein n=1 Tax=Pelagibacterium sp. H642 TaxID=1881069 RepID=UPI002814FFB2|nr:SIS domain-containing protein [Pelagibacterium sp. H642]WMT92660.1 SIS domain-containing protein [Pelagibacterium sp. H642]